MDKQYLNGVQEYPIQKNTDDNAQDIEEQNIEESVENNIEIKDENEQEINIVDK